MVLLAGELAPEEELSLRTAIQGCDECGPEFEMMALLMDFSGPALKATAPEGIDAVIMAAAKEHVAQVADPAPGFWARLGEWLESFAIGPQFAMATVMLLVVAVGFWYVPKHESHEVAGSTVVLSDPEGEAVAADDPSIPLLGAGQRNQGHVGELGEMSENEREETVQDDPEAEPLDRPVVRPPTKVANRTMRTRPTPAEEVETTRILPPAQAHSIRTQTAMAMTRGATRMTVPNNRMPTGRVTANQGNDDVEDLRSQSAAWAQDLEGIPMPSYTDETPAAPESADFAPAEEAGEAAADGLALHAEADEVPAPTVTPSRALLQLARNHRSQARCDQAVRHYESLLARFSSSPQVPAALMESADCYRRLGRISDAERALRRALQFASTRTNARRELTRLETIRAAQRESYAPSSESFEAY